MNFFGFQSIKAYSQKEESVNLISFLSSTSYNKIIGIQKKLTTDHNSVIEKVCVPHPLIAKYLNKIERREYNFSLKVKSQIQILENILLESKFWIPFI